MYPFLWKSKYGYTFYNAWNYIFDFRREIASEYLDIKEIKNEISLIIVKNNKNILIYKI